eukprot:gene32832-42210_t
MKSISENENKAQGDPEECVDESWAKVSGRVSDGMKSVESARYPESISK